MQREQIEKHAMETVLNAYGVKTAFVGGLMRAGSGIMRAAQSAGSVGRTALDIGKAMGDPRMKTMGNMVRQGATAFQQAGGLQHLGRAAGTMGAIGAGGYVAGRAFGSGQNASNPQQGQMR